MDNFCNYKPVSSNFDFVMEHIQTIDTELRDIQSKLMCSQYCPCTRSSLAPWRNLSETTLARFQRTNLTGTTAQDSRGMYRLFETNSTNQTAFSSFA